MLWRWLTGWTSFLVELLQLNCIVCGLFPFPIPTNGNYRQSLISKCSHSAVFLKGRAMIPNSVSSEPVQSPSSLPAKSQSVTAGLYAAALSTLSARLGLLSKCFVCVRLCVCVCVWLDLGGAAGHHWFVYLCAADSFSLGFFLHNTSSRGDQSVHFPADGAWSMYLIDWRRLYNSVEWLFNGCERSI